VQVQPSTAHLGDLITLDIRVMHGPGVGVAPPAFEKSLGTFEVYASTTFPTESRADQQTQHFQAVLQNFTTGPQLLPGLELTYMDASGRVGHLHTPDLHVSIEMVPPGPKDRGDIRGILGVLGPVAASPWWWLILAALAVGGGVWFWTKRRKQIQGPPPPPPIPADELALDQLRELLASGRTDAARVKEFYIALSDILRAYLENGFHCPALERTTGELMRDLRKRSDFNVNALMQLQDILEECDLVKFAKFRPEGPEALQRRAQAVQWVEQTRGLLKKEML
jgi:hypothetical protein